jgi:ubiquinone/menaquinone biosynthesis C-methylase UbiE
MPNNDAAFGGSIPALYDRCLGPMLFEPYAEDMAGRAAALQPGRILETAAGTGILTERLAAFNPVVEIVATDLNPDMLALAVERDHEPQVTLQQADAEALPFPDGSFDLVVCQFGVMFYPDRVAAHREARRVLKPGGRYLFNCWDSVDANPIVEQVVAALAQLFPEDAPGFLSRVPFGYHDRARIEADVRSGGFKTVEIETVVKTSRTTAEDAATGLCCGSPLRGEIEARAPGRLDEITAAVVAQLRSLSGSDRLEQPMSALVVTAE